MMRGDYITLWVGAGAVHVHVCIHGERVYALCFQIEPGAHHLVRLLTGMPLSLPSQGCSICHHTWLFK